MSKEHQRATTPKRGEPITAAMLRTLLHSMLRMIRGGNGIRVLPVGGQLVIESTGGRVGGGPASAADGDHPFKTVTTYEDLPDATSSPPTRMYRVLSGVKAGWIFVLNPGRDTWVSLSHWE